MSKKFGAKQLASAVLVFISVGIHAYSQTPPTAVIFENARIFNGTSRTLSSPSHVLVVGNLIKTISTSPIADPPGTPVTRIPGGGRTLMPGLIDNHWHAMLVRPTPAMLLTGDFG